MSQQHQAMSCDGNGPCASRNRHCDKCDPPSDDIRIDASRESCNHVGKERVVNGCDWFKITHLPTGLVGEGPSKELAFDDLSRKHTPTSEVETE